MEKGFLQMAKMTAQQAAAKWNRNYTGSAEQMKAGVQAVTVNPAQQAIAAGDRYINGVQRAYADGKWQAGLGRVTLAGWKQAYIDKGIANAAAGARLGQQKYEAHEREFGPIRDAIIASLPPRGTDAENDQRLLAFVRGMREARKNS